jgi:general secretion pathway protein M
VIVGLQAWWLGRSSRERLLIGVMLALAGGMVAWLLVVIPVRDALVSARARHAAALERNAAIRASIAVLEQKPLPATTISGALDQIVAASAGEAGFTLDANMAAGVDTTAITIAAARAPALLAWLDRLEQQGISVESLQLSAAANGAVSARATFKVRKP